MAGRTEVEAINSKMSSAIEIISRMCEYDYITGDNDVRFRMIGFLGPDLSFVASSYDQGTRLGMGLGLRLIVAPAMAHYEAPSGLINRNVYLYMNNA